MSQLNKPRSLQFLAFISLCSMALHNAQADELSSFETTTNAKVPAPWQYVALPERYAKPLTTIDVQTVDGKKALRLLADKSWGTVAHPWSGAAKTMTFQWRLDKALTQASFKGKATEDTALKVCASFDMPDDRIPSGERTLFKLAQFFSKEKLPTATLCYVWANLEAIGTIHNSPTTARVRYMVLDTGAQSLKTWKQHTRNVANDFLKAFGAESKTVPAITAIIVGADADNTNDNSLGYVADLSLLP
ncbi:MAG: DUF3047 domain-containing protein [Burkholderiaceae bacterium]|jgi:hypothetical protein